MPRDNAAERCSSGPGGALLTERYARTATGWSAWSRTSNASGDKEGINAATFLGVGVLHRDLLDRVPPDRPSHLFADLLMPLMADGFEIGICPHQGRWLEFTSPSSYFETLTQLVPRRIVAAMEKTTDYRMPCPLYRQRAR